jgi:hypothetical protein
VDTFRQIFASVIPVAALVILPVDAIRTIVERNQRISLTAAGSSAGNALVRSSGKVGLLVSFLEVLVLPVIAGGVAPAALAQLLGRRLSAQQVRSATLRRLPVLIVVSLVVHLLELVGLIGVLAGSAVVMVLCSVAAPVASVEGLGPIRSVKRSFELVRQRFWATAGRVVLIALFSSAMSVGLDLIPLTVGDLAGHSAGLIILGLANLAISTVVQTLAVIAATLMYVDLRVRLEGWDLALAIEAMPARR